MDIHFFNEPDRQDELLMRFTDASARFVGNEVDGFHRGGCASRLSLCAGTSFFHFHRCLYPFLLRLFSCQNVTSCSFGARRIEAISVFPSAHSLFIKRRFHCSNDALPSSSS